MIRCVIMIEIKNSLKEFLIISNASFFSFFDKNVHDSISVSLLSNLLDDIQAYGRVCQIYIFLSSTISIKIPNSDM